MIMLNYSYDNVKLFMIILIFNQESITYDCVYCDVKSMKYESIQYLWWNNVRSLVIIARHRHKLQLCSLTVLNTVVCCFLIYTVAFKQTK